MGIEQWCEKLTMIFPNTSSANLQHQNQQGLQGEDLQTDYGADGRSV